MDYVNFEDKDIIECIRTNSDYNAQNFILQKYKNLVTIRARAFYLTGGDLEDIIQEGMIGLFKAIENYDINSSATFETFAKICINRQIYTAIKTANRKKHRPLNRSYSLNVLTQDENNFEFLDFFSSSLNNPEDVIIHKEDKALLEKYIENTLSSFENTVLHYYLKGKNYSEISTILNKNEKAIDNALQRIRKKISSSYNF